MNLSNFRILWPCSPLSRNGRREHYIYLYFFFSYAIDLEIFAKFQSEFVWFTNVSVNGLFICKLYSLIPYSLKFRPQ
jgi:hypothetical protein